MSTDRVECIVVIADSPIFAPRIISPPEVRLNLSPTSCIIFNIVYFLKHKVSFYVFETQTQKEAAQQTF